MSWGAREGPTEKDKAGEEVNPDDGGTSGKLHPRQREWRVQRCLGRSWPGPGAAGLRGGSPGESPAFTESEMRATGGLGTKMEVTQLGLNRTLQCIC